MAKHKKQQAAIAISMKKKGKKPKGAKVMAKSLVKKKAGGSVSSKGVNNSFEMIRDIFLFEDFISVDCFNGKILLTNIRKAFAICNKLLL